MRKNKTRSARVANILGGFGYASCLLQWVWVGLIYVPWLLENDAIKRLVLPDTTAQQVPAIHVVLPSGVAIVVATISTVVVLALTMFVLLKIPSSVARGGKKVTQTSASALLPVVTHHKKISAKKQRLLSDRLIKITKIVLVLLPVVLSYGSYLVPTPLASEIIIVVAATLGMGSTLWFSLQYGLAHALKIAANNLI